ncbi:Hypothetical protein PHPALM_3877, partial [Phytophthora palmivora]
MYHGAARDRGDKRQRLTPPPNEVWMEAIMSKGKTPDGYIPASAVSAGGVAPSSTAAWQGRARAPPDWDATPQASMAQGSRQHQQYAASGYQGRPVERPTPYQGSSTGYQGRPVNAGYQGRMMDGSTGYQGRPMDGATRYPGRAVNGVMGYQGRMVPNSTAYQGRTTESSAGFQNRAMDGATAYQERAMAAVTGYQGRPQVGAAAYQGRLVQSSDGFQGRVVDGSEAATGKLYQGKTEASSSGKMAEDYKRERKLPPRVEEMLREQVNLDLSVLHDAFAVAMEDLIPEREASFVAKGLCHLCGISENHYVPVVNFCPHADDNHSLCREHLRSVYRVRMEALFVGRNGSAPNRRLLRCLVCTSGCPCTGCTARKEKEVQKYKRYLLDTLRRSGQGSVPTVRDDRTIPTVPGSVTHQALGYGNTQSISDNGIPQTKYPPTPPTQSRPRSVELEKTHEDRKQVQDSKPEYDRYPGNERNNRDGHALSTQAEAKSPPQYSQKRAAKDTSADIISKRVDSAQVTGSRVDRITSPRVHQGSVESPSAVTVMNCKASENSLVQLLSTLNQGATPANSMAMDRSKLSSKDRGSEPRYGTNGSPAKEQGSDDTEMEASPRTYSGRGFAGRRLQADDSPYQDQSSTSSINSSDSPRRDRSSVGARSVEDNQTRKRKASASDAEDSPAPRASEMPSRDDARVASRGETTTKEKSIEDKRQRQSDGSPKLSAKSDGREKNSLFKSEAKESHSSPTFPPPPPLHRGPGRPRKDGTPAVSRKNLQGRKPATAPKQTDYKQAGKRKR